MKKILKNIGLFIVNNIVGLILGMLFFGVASADPVSFVLSAQDIPYDNTNSGSSYSNVKSALDDLDAKADALLNPADYASFAVGDTVTINGDGYHVITASGHNQDYVTLLKDNPLTVSEIQALSLTVDNPYGTTPNWAGIVYDTSTDEYESSNVKSYVDAWATNNFANDDLKEVAVTSYGDYKARLITMEELSAFYPNCDYTNNNSCNVEQSTPSWVYNSQYDYWTMSGDNNNNSKVWNVNISGSLYPENKSGNGPVIRPVINLYKSKIPAS